MCIFHYYKVLLRFLDLTLSSLSLKLKICQRPQSRIPGAVRNVFTPFYIEISFREAGKAQCLEKR